MCLNTPAQSTIDIPVQPIGLSELLLTAVTLHLAITPASSSSLAIPYMYRGAPNLCSIFYDLFTMMYASV